MLFPLLKITGMTNEPDAAGKKFWFKAKRYGWGWSPAAWQGWLVTLGFVLAVVILATQIAVLHLWVYLASLVLLTLLMIGICYMTGEKPRWRWGEDK